MTRGRALLRRPARLTLVVSTTEPVHKCDVYPLWTASKGYVATCSEHFGEPLSVHPSLRGA